MTRLRHHLTRSRHRGFTLLETIAAIVILAVAAPPLLFAISESHIQRANPYLASKARWLAVEKLEDVIADRHSTSRGYDYLLPGNYPAESPVAGYAGYARSVSFQETTADLVTAGDGYLTITISVTWTDATQTVRTLTVDAVVTEYN